MNKYGGCNLLESVIKVNMVIYKHNEGCCESENEEVKEEEMCVIIFNDNVGCYFEIITMVKHMLHGDEIADYATEDGYIVSWQQW